MSRREMDCGFGFSLSRAEDDDDLARFWRGPLAGRWNLTSDEGVRYVTAGTIHDCIDAMGDVATNRMWEFAQTPRPALGEGRATDEAAEIQRDNATHEVRRPA